MPCRWKRAQHGWSEEEEGIVGEGVGRLPEKEVDFKEGEGCLRE